MDQELLKLLTKLKIQGKKLMGLEIDIVRLSSDRHYASEMLKKLTASEDEDLVMSAIDFMGKLGLVKAPALEPAAAPAGEAETPSDPLDDKYIHTLR